MHFAFRTDASTRIGTGHVARSLALASALKKRGVAITFLTRPFRGNRDAAIRAAGFTLHPLGGVDDDEAWLGVSVDDDIAATSFALRRLAPVNWLVIDQYALGERLERAMRPLVGRIAVIDDLANRRHDCDLLIDQAYHPRGRSRYAGLVPPTAQLFLGPRFAPLRAEFSLARERLLPRDGTIRKVLIFLSGADRQGVTLKAVRAFSAAGLDADADVVLPRDAPHFEAVAALCARLERVRFIGETQSMASLVAGADLAIGSPGIASWERAYLGLPAIVVSLADNQRDVGADLAKAGAVVYLGATECVEEEGISAELRRCAADPAEVRRMGKRAEMLMNGHSAAMRRLIETLSI